MERLKNLLSKTAATVQIRVYVAKCCELPRYRELNFHTFSWASHSFTPLVFIHNLGHTVHLTFFFFRISESTRIYPF